MKDLSLPLHEPSWTAVAALQLAHIDEIAQEVASEARDGIVSSDAWWTAVGCRRVAFDLAVQLDALDRRPEVEHEQTARQIQLAKDFTAARQAEVALEQSQNPASPRPGVFKRLRAAVKGSA